MRTECGHCHKDFSTPTAAAKHVAKEHSPIEQKPIRGQPVFQVSWNKTGIIRQPRNGEKNG